MQILFFKWIYERSYIQTAENNMKTWLIIEVKYATSAVVKLKPEKNSGLNGIQTHDVPLQYQCSALPTELSTEPTWELFSVL